MTNCATVELSFPTNPAADNQFLIMKGAGGKAFVTEPQVRLAQRAQHVVASAQLVHYTEITPENIDTFHFHGNMADLPLTAILAVPYDYKSGVLLRGRYVAETTLTQIVIPITVIEGLIRQLFKIKRIFETIFAVVSVAMCLAIILVMTLRLRQAEMEAMFKLGCSRRKVAELVAAELCLLIALSLGMTAGLMVGTVSWQADLLQRLLL